MERYITAELELVDLDEDVITASGATNTTSERQFVNCVFDHSLDSWIVSYDDGTTEEHHINHMLSDDGKPDVCG